MKHVKILDGEYAGQILEGHRFYLDHLHTGNSPDLFTVKTPDGNMTITSDKIDVEFYEEQLLADELLRLGANIGDTVKITRTGSGWYRSGWDKDALHQITKISPSGYVEFDHGMGQMFRPDVELIREYLVDAGVTSQSGS